MKRLFFTLITACGVFTSYAQTAEVNNVDSMKVADSLRVADSMYAAMDAMPRPWKADSLQSRWVLDINGLAGMLTHDITMGNTLNNYTNYIPGSYTGKLKLDNGKSYGADLNISYFPGHRGHWGVGLGFMYLYQQADMTMDAFNVQYQSTDANGNTFRQVITANRKIKEQLTITNMNVPLLLKYKNRFTRHSGFTAEAGVMYNVQYQSHYKTDASFDYGAIYQEGASTEGVSKWVYDNATTPSKTDWLITKDNIRQADKNAYMSMMRDLGYNVGLGMTPGKKEGDTKYAVGSLGAIARAAYSYYFSDHVALNLGVYYMFQQMKNDVKSSYRLTDKVGDYNSFTNAVSKSNNQSYGFDLGLRFFIGHYTPRFMPVAAHPYIDTLNPSICGLSDGAFTLHGLSAGDPVAIYYMLNGTPQPVRMDTVNPLGGVKIPNLAAGAYTDIKAVMGYDTFRFAPVNLANPALGYFSESYKNPTANGTCDGEITMHGLHPGLPVTINYNFNGIAQAPFKSMLAADGTVTLPRLCAGLYTQIRVVANNTCTVNGNEINLVGPPPPPPPAPAPAKASINTPILFDVNKTTIHESSYPILMEAVIQLNEDASASLVIDGFTDITGRAAYNKVLSIRRANAVKSYLIRNGISAKRLQAVGHGIADPIGDNTTPEGRAKNRRVMMELKHNKGGVEIKRD
jgi:outer membrane protein OmpA-like peptidoglycan-associated protein